MFPPIETWPLSMFHEDHWRVGYPTAALSDSRREDLISTESVMTPSEKEELLHTVSCQGKEYSQGQTDPHLIIRRKNRREYLVGMVKLCSPRTLRRGI